LDEQQKGNGARTKSSHALGAANLKTELTREFPGMKLSVKSESFSGGDASRNPSATFHDPAALATLAPQYAVAGV